MGRGRGRKRKKKKEKPKKAKERNEGKESRIEKRKERGMWLPGARERGNWRVVVLQWG